MGARIALVGANGKVGSEVAVILKQAGAEPIPIVRGAMGAAFLRSMGVPVRRGSVADPDQAAAAMAGADLIAILAYAPGIGPAVRNAHDRLLAGVFDHAPAGVPVVFFSTLAVYRGFGPPGHERGAYGREKLRNEKVAMALARRSGRPATVFRLGHVCGEYQPITEIMRRQIRSGSISIPDPERHANCVHTATIADALLGAAEGRIAQRAVYDLVNAPTWSWCDVLEYEAKRTGADLVLRQAPGAPPPQPFLKAGLRRVAGGLFGSELLKSNADRLLAALPGEWETRIRVQHARQRTAREVAMLAPPLERLDSAWYPGWDARLPEGLTPTAELLGDPRYRAPSEPVADPWPEDI